MKNFILKGQTKLSGSVAITGSKNAVLPIIGAGLLYKGVTKLKFLMFSPFAAF